MKARPGKEKAGVLKGGPHHSHPWRCMSQAGQDTICKHDSQENGSRMTRMHYLLVDHFPPAHVRELGADMDLEDAKVSASDY